MTSGVKVKDIVVGDGRMAKRGDLVVIHYRLTLSHGDEIQNTHGGSPMSICLGRRDVIAGLEYGLAGMRVGGRRTIRVSPHLGYREQGVAGVVPPNAVLIFDVELLEVHEA